MHSNTDRNYIDIAKRASLGPIPAGWTNGERDDRHLKKIGQLYGGRASRQSTDF